jgi:hypothetical protein
MKHVLTAKLICDKDQVSNSEDQINEQWNACFVQMLCAFKRAPFQNVLHIVTNF